MPVGRKSERQLSDESTNLARRVVEIRQQLAYRNSCTIMKNNLWVSAEVERYLDGLGLRVVNGQLQSDHGEVKVESRQTESTRARDVRVKSEKEKALDAAMKELGTDDASDVVPVKWGTLADVPYSEYEKRILPAIEPMAFSSSNVKKGCLKMQNKQEAVQKTCEFSTGVSIHLKLLGRLRLWSVLLEALKQGSVARMRRGADRGFSVDYADNGVFALEWTMDGDVAKVMAVLVVGKVRSELQPDKFPGWPDSPANYYIENNHSEQTAEVRNVNLKAAMGYKLEVLFDKSNFPVAPMLMGAQNAVAALTAGCPLSTLPPRKKACIAGLAIFPWH